MTVDRRVHQTSRDVDDAEHSSRLASVYAGRCILVRHTDAIVIIVLMIGFLKIDCMGDKYRGI